MQQHKSAVANIWILFQDEFCHKLFLLPFNMDFI